ncbi:MAG: HD domain-containing protein [Alphaproteobacteria bacterium]|nr:HD domain-containing protein [Alphaproteobacteria bacterium]USO07451.1 MAG: HD domain-containing protein [Rhodospirillales bacterium]
MSGPYADFITRELAALEAYDNGRPPGHPYAFHLHVRRVAEDMRALALAMGMDAARAAELHLATLAHDAGKRMLPVGIWDISGKPDDKTRHMRRDHTWLGAKLVDDAFGAADQAPFPALLRDLMQHHHEAMDGSGFLGMKGDELSLEARMLCVCDAFDGYSAWRPHFGERDLSPNGVLNRMRVEKSGQFDAEILAIFSKIKNVVKNHAAV